ncbi:MAG: hypothetical protein CMO98_06495 [Woeseia sp.]|nr:hypothetical protein [Woeseia sp.]|tara:strand:- start:2823 stop:4169 length:1347 start_codon:yes stop_codon:yes gene_type:complete
MVNDIFRPPMLSENTNTRKPPGPSSSQNIGVNPESLVTLKRLQSEYGKVIRMVSTKGRPLYFINDPEVMRTLLVRHHSNYRKGPGFERVKMLLGNGLIVSDGSSWRRARRMIQPSFTRQSINHFIKLMIECSHSLIGRWETVAKEGGKLDITRETSDFSLELILRCIFGDDYEAELLKHGTNPFGFLSQDPNRNLRVVMQVRDTRALIKAIIAKRRKEKKTASPDFLSKYLEATDKTGIKFTDEELLDEIITLLVAGHETSAGTLNWAWLQLARHKHVAQILVNEATKLGAAQGCINQENLNQMSYTQAFLDETLRLYPPVWIFSRRALDDGGLLGWHVEAGSDLFISPYLMHRDPSYWNEPEVFNPGRFLPDAEEPKGPQAYFPFSLGPRRCLGEYFSFLEMKVHLTLLAPQFNMQLDDEKEPGLDLGINLRSNQNITLRPRLRMNN